MPTRKVRGSGGNITGKFPSLKMGKMLQYESTIERDYLFLLDYEADITYLEDQPLIIEYEHEGKTRHYTPDMHIIQAGHNILAECKPIELVNDEDNQRKFTAGRDYCARRGWSFQVVTDQDIRVGYRLRNVKVLRQYACHIIRPEFIGWIYTLLQNAPTSPTIAQIQAVASISHTEVWAGLLHMAYHHEIVIPLEGGLISTISPVCLSIPAAPGGKP